MVNQKRYARQSPLWSFQLACFVRLRLIRLRFFSEFIIILWRSAVADGNWRDANKFQSSSSEFKGLLHLNKGNLSFVRFYQNFPLKINLDFIVQPHVVEFFSYLETILLIIQRDKKILFHSPVRTSAPRSQTQIKKVNKFLWLAIEMKCERNL